MRKLVIPFMCLIMAGAGTMYAQSAQTATAQAKDPNAGVLKFETMTHDYGEVPEGPVAAYDFMFTNTGKKPIIISSAQGSCGCTTATYPHDPIMPGEKGKIHVMYNTDNRPGTISKVVTVISNASEPTAILHIKGSVRREPRP